MNYNDKHDIAQEVANELYYKMNPSKATNSDFYSFGRFIIHAVFAVCIGGFVGTGITDSLFLGIIAGIVAFLIFVAIHAVRELCAFGIVFGTALKYLAVTGISIGINAIIYSIFESKVVIITAIITLIIDFIIIKLIGDSN